MRRVDVAWSMKLRMTGNNWGRPFGCPLCMLLLVALPVGAQEATAPLRFGVAWSRGNPHGDLSEIADAPQGFTAQVALPVSRTARVGLRAEFSVLTFPERSLQIGSGESGATIEVTVRGTVGFTGAGPRIETRLGPFALALGAMGGFVRVITDATARSDVDGARTSAALSLSDYAVAAKSSVDIHLALYRGPSGTAVGLVGGVDWLTGGKVAFPQMNSFRLSSPGVLTLDRPVVAPSMLVIRGGVGVEF